MRIDRSSITTGKDGHRYKTSVFIEEHQDADKYPEGVKAIFRLIRLDVNDENESELVVLVDNHKPFGFHSHDALPENHGYRVQLHLDDWREAWKVFQVKCQEILK